MVHKHSPVHPLNGAKITTVTSWVVCIHFILQMENLRLKTIEWPIAVLVRQELEPNSGNLLLYHVERLKTRS